MRKMKKLISVFVVLSMFLTLPFVMSFAVPPQEITLETVLFDFEDGQLGGWTPNPYGGTPEGTTIEVANLGENNKAMSIGCSFEDLQARTYWQAVSFFCNGTFDLEGCQALAFDVTLDMSKFEGYGYIRAIGGAVENGSFSMFGEHLITKTDIDLAEDELITVRCYSYLNKEMHTASQLLFYIVGSAIDYDGPLYVDNIRLVTGTQPIPDASPVTLNRTTPVGRYGALQVIGTNLCDQNGNPVQLRGMSCPANFSDGRFMNRAVFQALAYDWKCDVVRIAIPEGSGKDDAYTGSAADKQLLFNWIDYAIETGMYVLVDWHVLEYGDPLDEHNSGADAFFDEVSERYAGVPNIIYEICNEPNGASVTWTNNIKPYAERIIPIIRANSPDSVVVVGTGSWSQQVYEASLDPLTFDNVMYTVHFYVKTHKQSYRDNVAAALQNGVAVFATEWGMTAHTGANGVDVEETETWLAFLDQNNISWTNWYLGIGSAESAVLSSLIPDGTQYGIKVFKRASTLPLETSDEGYRYWKEDDLTFCGKYIRNLILSHAPEEILPLEITDIKVENGLVPATVIGGTGQIKYSFYVLGGGKVWAKTAYTFDNTFDISSLESGSYRLRVYAQDQAGERVVNEITLEV